jgi:hypothetical protein
MIIKAGILQHKVQNLYDFCVMTKRLTSKPKYRGSIKKTCTEANFSYSGIYNDPYKQWCDIGSLLAFNRK